MQVKKKHKTSKTNENQQLFYNRMQLEMGVKFNAIVRQNT